MADADANITHYSIRANIDLGCSQWQVCEKISLCPDLNDPCARCACITRSAKLLTKSIRRQRTTIAKRLSAPPRTEDGWVIGAAATPGQQPPQLCEIVNSLLSGPKPTIGKIRGQKDAEIFRLCKLAKTHQRDFDVLLPVVDDLPSYPFHPAPEWTKRCHEFGDAADAAIRAVAAIPASSLAAVKAKVDLMTCMKDCISQANENELSASIFADIVALREHDGNASTAEN